MTLLSGHGVPCPYPQIGEGARMPAFLMLLIRGSAENVKILGIVSRWEGRFVA